MPVSRNSGTARALLGLLLLGLAPVATAQTAAPPPSSPSGPPPAAPIALGPPISLTPVGAAPAPAAIPTANSLPPATAATPATVPPAGSLGATPLAAPDADEAGALPADVAPLPPGLWAGTGRNVVDALLGQIVPTTSPALQDLAFRLLASPATAPAGTIAPGALVAVRAEQLASFGRPDAALGLLRAVPPAQMVSDAGEVTVELLFLNQDQKGACDTVKSRQPGWQGIFWDEAQVTCTLLGGQTAPAQIGIDMLNEEGAGASGFAALVSRASGFDVPPPQELPAPQPLSLALIARAGKGLPPSILTTGSLPVLRAVALTPGFPEAARLIAAEKAASFGALPADRLAEAYLALPLDPGERASPMNAALHSDAVRARAILFNAARDATDPAARAQYLDVFLEKSAAAGLYPVAVRAAKALLLSIPATPDRRADAIDVARALYALGLGDAARPWFDLLPPGGQQQFLPLAAIVGGDHAPGWGNAVLLDPTTAAGDATTAAVNRAALAAQLLIALGRPAPATATLPLLAAGGIVTWESPAAGPPILLRGATQRHELGGTILALLASLGSAGAAAPAPLVIDAVTSLHQLGLDTEARGLAIDAAIAAGL